MPGRPLENMANALKNMAFIWQKPFENKAFIWHRLFHEKQYNKMFIFLSNIFYGKNSTRYRPTRYHSTRYQARYFLSLPWQTSKVKNLKLSL
jgi:hypothetical protein